LTFLKWSTSIRIYAQWRLFAKRAVHLFANRSTIDAVIPKAGQTIVFGLVPHLLALAH
jgi:CO dehydrogenase/acetyl-CoA synthase alpha subunit